jgi:hypothetical protein
MANVNEPFVAGIENFVCGEKGVEDWFFCAKENGIVKDEGAMVIKIRQQMIIERICLHTVRVAHEDQSLA